MWDCFGPKGCPVKGDADVYGDSCLFVGWMGYIVDNGSLEIECNGTRYQDGERVPKKSI